MTNSRREAAFAVARWLATHDFPAGLLPEGKDRAFVQDVVYTTIRRLRPLRAVLGELVARWPKGELEALLYVGAAQILYMDDVPDFAAVNETVAAAKACPNPNVAKVVNGVLRNLIRRREEFVAKIAACPVEVRESFPTELVRRWTARFGAEATAKLCAWYNEPAETFLARKDGSFVALERGRNVADVAGYAEGEFIVQDPGTKLAVGLVDAKPGEKILDACAAPGGKTIQLAWRGADVTACEVNPKRRRRLEENLKRLHLDGQVKVASSLDPSNPPILQKVKGKGERSTVDGNNSIVSPLLSNLDLATSQASQTSQTPQISQAFSKILVDAPCSNTGVLRRRPDARWNWNAEKLAALVKMQAEILDQVVPLVAEGGTIVYSTCSIEPEENVQQVEAFVARHPEFKLAGTAESLPFETGHDGAFAAVLEKF